MNIDLDAILKWDLDLTIDGKKLRTRRFELPDADALSSFAGQSPTPETVEKFKTFAHGFLIDAEEIALTMVQATGVMNAISEYAKAFQGKSKNAIAEAVKSEVHAGAM